MVALMRPVESVVKDKVATLEEELLTVTEGDEVTVAVLGRGCAGNEGRDKDEDRVAGEGEELVGGEAGGGLSEGTETNDDILAVVGDDVLVLLVARGGSTEEDGDGLGDEVDLFLGMVVDISLAATVSGNMPSLCRTL
jgi:hypothetical protein